MSIGWSTEQHLVYNLQFASRLGVCKSKANISNLHTCFDVNTSFVMQITRLLTHTIPYATDDKRIFLTHRVQTLVRTETVHV